MNEKIIALCVQTTRMSTGVLKASMRKFLDGMSRQKQTRVQVKQAVKTGKAQEKGRERIIYSITDYGQKTLYEWLKKPVQKDELRYETLLKLFFGNEAERFAVLFAHLLRTY